MMIIFTGISNTHESGRSLDGLYPVAIAAASATAAADDDDDDKRGGT